MSRYEEASPNLDVAGIVKRLPFGGFGSIILALLVLFTTPKWFEMADADEIVVVQDFFDGDLHWYTSPGIKPQFFGKTTTYPKRDIYRFEGARIRFNEGGHGEIRGSVQSDMPLDVDNLTKLHTRYGSREAILDQVMKRTVDKVIYMTGPHMSSRESYAEKRTDLITYVQDQIDHGVYRVTQRTIREQDPISGQERTRMVAEIVLDNNGTPQRAEPSVVSEFGIRAFNFAIEELKYDERVEAQIQQQQQIAMDVQTAIAEARKAEQRKLTVDQEGAANAASAKWEQEVIKAKEITAAEQRLSVAQFDRQTAEQRRQEQILLGQGEAERKRLNMQADGALEPKLAALVEINKAYAAAIQGYSGSWVPSVVMGGGGNSQVAGGGAMELMNLLMAKTARDLAVDVQARAQPRPR